MPGVIYQALQMEIQQAIDALKGRRATPSCLLVPAVYRSEMVRVLKEWQEEAFAEFGTKRIRRQAIRQRDNFALPELLLPGLREEDMPKPPKDCQKQDAFYSKTGVLMPFTGQENRPSEQHLLPCVVTAYE